MGYDFRAQPHFHRRLPQFRREVLHEVMPERLARQLGDQVRLPAEVAALLEEDHLMAALRRHESRLQSATT